ncbi:energy-coupling factor ABC transporter ATP-binding protein [Melghirimyces algeriensis]|uniref:energy-coupling factor ABC transporter ATP-binding protein n=1 Tax=Melghirimyces algeriensis TaxID=910412 RepID=UPI001C8F4E51|nr:ABC transporter ATP-binding protein [Melghirimyces algeriensis]
MIQVKNLSFSYDKKRPVLADITLDLDGRSTAIVGQNGAGKTTFVKLLKGLLKPDFGEIHIGKTSVKEATVASLARKVGLVFQNPDEQIFKGTVRDEVMFGALNLGQDKETAETRAREALERVGLGHLSETNPQDLSLSEKKRVSIASVVAMDPEIIIFDEPTIAQDHAGKEQIKHLIRGLQEQNKLVMTIIHDMDFVAECFERTLVFNEGKLLMDGLTRDVFSRQDVLHQAHLEPPSVTQLGKKLGFAETFLTVKELVSGLRNGGNR